MEEKGGLKWEEKRKKFFKDRRAEEVEKRRDEGDIWFGELINKGNRELGRIRKMAEKRRV